MVGLQVLLFALRGPDGGLGGGLRGIVVPFYRGGAFLERAVRGKVAELGDKRRLIKENELLKEELGVLTSENALLRGELEKLRMEVEANRVEREIGFEVIPAQVIGRDPYDWLGKAIIDRGKNDGIEEGMVVVTYQGMIGKIEAAYDDYAVVRLILSPLLAVGVLVQRTRDLGVAVGDGNGLCIIRYLYRTSGLQKGDLVVTSGLGPKTPRGIVVGKVVEVREQEGSLFKEAVLQPSCDFSLLERVLVIKSAT
ncbi:MAG: rod shape-determining protein MreC, partial [Candidatus Caldatribacteriaceae bacterium]